MPFSPNSALYEKNYPRNINYMPAVIFFASLDFGKNCYSRTVSYGYELTGTPIFKLIYTVAMYQTESGNLS